MSLLRFKAVKEASDRKAAVAVVPPKESPEKYYAEAVFNRQRMYEYLPKRHSTGLFMPLTTNSLSLANWPTALLPG